LSHKKGVFYVGNFVEYAGNIEILAWKWRILAGLDSCQTYISFLFLIDHGWKKIEL